MSPTQARRASATSPPPLSADPALVDAVLAALAAEPAGMSLPRLCKRLGVRMSVLMRTLAWIGDTHVGGVEGEGLVQVTQQDDRQFARLTGKGREHATRSARRS